MSRMPQISATNVTTYPMNTGKGTPSPARACAPKFAGPTWVSFCNPCANMITPTITRTTSGARPASRAIGERLSVLILFLLLRLHFHGTPSNTPGEDERSTMGRARGLT